MATRDPRIGLYLIFPTHRMTREGIMVRIVRWSRGGDRMPIIPGLVYAPWMVNRGVHGTPGNRRLVRQILGLLHQPCLVCLLKSPVFLLGAKVDARKVYPQALSNTG